MPPQRYGAVVEAIKLRDLARLRTALRADPKAAIVPKVAGDAAGHAWIDGLAELIAHGAHLNGAFRNYRPLHALIQTKPHDAGVSSAQHLKCLKWMLAHGADPELAGAWPAARAVIIAAFVGEAAYVDALFDAGASRDGFTAAATGDRRGVERCLTKNADFARTRDAGSGLTALQCVAGSRLGVNDRTLTKKLLAIATLLIDRGADPNAKTRSWGQDVDVAYFAAKPDRHDMFELLLTRGADPHAALRSAAWQTEMTNAEIALRHGAEPDRVIDGDRPLLNNLVRWGQVAPSLWLLKHGATPDIADERGWTAVHQAVSRGSERLLKALLSAGGDPARPDKRGQTPRMLARTLGKPKLLSLLE